MNSSILSYRKQPIDPVASIIEEMRTSTPPSTVSSDSQSERPTGSKRVDERAAEQERRRREAVRIKSIFIKLINISILLSFSNPGLLI